MTTFHAALWIDHQAAQILGFDLEHVEAHSLKASSRHSRTHGSQVRTEHEFFGHVCDALEGITEVLVLGPHTGVADFQHYAKKHRPATAERIVAYQPSEHLSENQIVALARKFFVAHDRMEGRPTPG